MRILGVPLSFVVVVAAVVALLIFFGAWAVSVDAANHERSLSSVVLGGAAGYEVRPGAGLPANNPGVPASLETDLTESGSAADTWWGQSLILVCPLH